MALRLVVDAVAAGLLVASLAYWWLGNVAHEIVGTGMFAIVLSHNIFNRRWYGRLRQIGRVPRGRILIGLNAALLVTMLTLLATSLMVSRTLFSGLLSDAGLTAIEAHIASAYWALVIVGIHIGLNWPIVESAFLRGFGAGEPGLALRLVIGFLGLAVAARGMVAFDDMAYGQKLLARPTLDMWDFEQATAAFFVNHVAVIALFAVATRGTIVIVQAARQRLARA